jgi:regulator of protease activity HflC (stomatin/prohibitin superfamily)
VGFLLFAPIVLALVHGIGGTNPDTPAGHEGYVFHQPLALGQREFIEVQRGPTSTGWRWRQYATNIDMRVATYTEDMQIFSSDNLEVSFEAHARIRLRPGSVRQIVERFSGADWYANNVRRPYVTAVREEVRQHEAFTIKGQSVQIGEAILRRLRQEYRGTPFEFVSLSIGNISYPESVVERVVANLAAEQRRQRREVERQIAEANAQIREIRARGEAEAQQIEQATLTPLFVQHEAAELYRALADDEADEDGVAAARVVVVVPTRNDRAGVPRIYQGSE